MKPNKRIKSLLKIINFSNYKAVSFYRALSVEEALKYWISDYLKSIPYSLEYIAPLSKNSFNIYFSDAEGIPLHLKIIKA